MIYKKTAIYLIALFIINTSCFNDNYNDLEYNIFDDDTIEIHTFNGVELTPNGLFHKNIKVYFSSIYEDLPAVQKEKITDHLLTYNGATYTIPLNQSFFVRNNIEIGKTVCFELAFKLMDDLKTKNSEPYCVLVN